jgi:hypothetical protein
MIAGLLIGGIILLFVGLSIIGFITPMPGDQDSAASGVVHRQ